MYGYKRRWRMKNLTCIYTRHIHVRKCWSTSRRCRQEPNYRNPSPCTFSSQEISHKDEETIEWSRKNEEGSLKKEREKKGRKKVPEREDTPLRIVDPTLPRLSHLLLRLLPYVFFLFFFFSLQASRTNKQTDKPHTHTHTYAPLLISIPPPYQIYICLYNISIYLSIYQWSSIHLAACLS